MAADRATVQVTAFYKEMSLLVADRCERAA